MDTPLERLILTLGFEEQTYEYPFLRLTVKQTGLPIWVIVGKVEDDDELFVGVGPATDEGAALSVAKAITPELVKATAIELNNLLSMGNYFNQINDLVDKLED